MSTDLLFVYGTLMSPFDHPHAKHLHAKARCLGPARMPGILYQVTWYPGATDRLNHHANASESWVYGELWQLDTELLLTEIDRYEECSPNDPSPHEYQRVLRLVEFICQSEWQTAWVYLYQRDPLGLKCLEDGRFGLEQFTP